MGALKKLFKKAYDKAGKPGGSSRGSQVLTGIRPGDPGSNKGQGQGERTVPGRRRPRTALGPGADQL